VQPRTYTSTRTKTLISKLPLGQINSKNPISIVQSSTVGLLSIRPVQYVVRVSFAFKFPMI